MNMSEQKAYAQRISAQYAQKELSDLQKLKALDRKVKKPALVFSMVVGIIGAIIMGCGMSLVMTDIGTILGLTQTMLPGIVIGLVGMMIAIVNYPLHKAILGARRRKYAERIIELSDKIMNQL